MPSPPAGRRGRAGAGRARRGVPRGRSRRKSSATASRYAASETLESDNDVLAASQPDHHGRPRQQPVRCHDADLLVEVAIAGHTAQLDDPAQLHLAPPAAGFGPAQSRDQRLSLSAQLVRALARDGDLLGQRRVRRAARRVGLAQLSLDAGQGVFERLHHLLDRSLAVVQLAGRSGAGGVQPAFGDLKERPGAAVERFCRQRLEPLG